MIKGHKQTYKILKEKVDKDARYIWSMPLLWVSLSRAGQ